MKGLLFSSTLCALGLFLLPTQQAQAATCDPYVSAPSSSNNPDYFYVPDEPKHGVYVSTKASTSDTCDNYSTPRDWAPSNSSPYKYRWTGKLVENISSDASTGGADAVSEAVGSAMVSKLSIIKTPVVGQSLNVSSTSKLSDMLWIEKASAGSTEITQIPFELCGEYGSDNRFVSATTNNAAEMRHNIYGYRNATWAKTFDSKQDSYTNNGAAYAKFGNFYTHPDAKKCLSGYLNLGGTRGSFAVSLSSTLVGTPAGGFYGTTDGTFSSNFKLGALPAGVTCHSSSGVFPGCERPVYAGFFDAVPEKRCAYGSYIDGSMGFKHQQETDYSGGLLSFTRSYRSDAAWLNSMGERWRHNFDRNVNLITNTAPANPTSTVDIRTGHGGIYTFREETTGVWAASDTDITSSFVSVFDGATLTGYLYTDENDNKEYYNTSGKITRIEYLGGGALDFVQALQMKKIFAL